MSNNNMREIGYAFINLAGEFQFISGSMENVPTNSIMVYCTEADFQKACDRARELFAAMKGE